MRWQGYPKMKDSGIEWLGEIPERWSTIKFKKVAFYQEGPGLRNWQFTDNGVRVICVTNITEYGIDFSNYEKFISQDEYEEGYRRFTVRSGDLLLSSSGNSWGKIAEYSDSEKVILNTSTIRINELKGKKLAKGFIKWMLQSRSSREQLGLMMTGACQPNFGPSHLSNLIVTLPPMEDQRPITKYLDRKTKHIDTLIAKKERQIELLQEKRSALISHAVTKGLNPKARMKDSGIEWLGEIPVGWGTRKLKHLFENLDHRRVPLSGEERSYMDQEYPYYGASGIIDYVDDYIFDESLILVAEDGANLLSRSTPLAFKAEGKYWVNNHAHILKPLLGDLMYWEGVLQTFDYTPLITGAAQPKLTSENLSIIELPFPPPEEQNAIVFFLNHETQRIDNLTREIRKSISMLHEYRTALISAAVTGKINVRKEAA